MDARDEHAVADRDHGRFSSRASSRKRHAVRRSLAMGAHELAANPPGSRTLRPNRTRRPICRRRPILEAACDELGNAEVEVQPAGVIAGADEQLSRLEDPEPSLEPSYRSDLAGQVEPRTKRVSLNPTGTSLLRPRTLILSDVGGCNAKIAIDILRGESV